LDGWFFAEHHAKASYSLTTSPNLLVAAASQRTSRLRLGNMVTVLPYHHPFRAAEEIRLLDVLTNGRLEIGLGRGAIRYEQAAWGVERSVTHEMFEVGFELLMRFLTEDTVDYDTQWWKGSGASVSPDPIQKPYPPMWMAAAADHSFDKAARLGMHCSTAFLYPEMRKARLAAYHEAWANYQPGLAPGKFAVLAHVVVGETEAEAIKFGKKFVESEVEHFLHVISSRPAQGEDPSYASHAAIYEHMTNMSFEQLVDESLIIFGSVDHCVEQLTELRNSGVDLVMAWIQFSDLDYEFANRSLRLFAEEVLPRVEQRDKPSEPLAPAATSGVSA
jgi:alkanesulfonate monooxygenase SsuD/methylene tetrahydromethanopterin reductase-like flavin-dependent oxidoreductase (luciferase family)